MEKKEYKKMHELGRTHWWFLGSEGLMVSLLEKYLPAKRGLKLLDIGCGPGRMLGTLQKFGEVSGLDVEKEAIKYCRQLGYKNAVLADAADLPFKGDSFDAVIAVDLLYHENADEGRILCEAHRVLRKNGLLFLNECAFEALRGRHDIAMHAKKRFTREELVQLLESAGFEVVKASYWNFFLFPVVALARVASRYMDGKESDIAKTPALANSILKRLLFLENCLIKHIDFPWGVSVVCVARKR